MTLTVKAILLFATIFVALAMIFYMGYCCGRSDTYEYLLQSIDELLNRGGGKK